MLFYQPKGICGTCNGVSQWLSGLTLLAVGLIGLLQQLGVFVTSPWGWTWPVIVLVWAVVMLLTNGCKSCGK